MFRHPEKYRVDYTDGVTVEITRKRVRSLRIVVGPDAGRVRVSAPVRMSREFIQAFIVSKMPWIKKHLSRFVLSAQPKLPIEPWQRDTLKSQIAAFVVKYENIMGVKVAEFRIKKMKTRWGTCNPRARRIWLNLELVRKPLYCLEYVVVHEMVHFFEKSHNARFKSFMDKFLPSWREYRRELKQI